MIIEMIKEIPKTKLIQPRKSFRKRLEKCIAEDGGTFGRKKRPTLSPAQKRPYLFPQQDMTQSAFD